MISIELEQQIETIVVDLGYSLWACEYLPQGKHSMLRIYIDSDSGVGIGDCEAVSKLVSAYLDVEDPIKGNYFLEVSSPGIPRPLMKLTHFKHYIGESAYVKLAKPVENKRKYIGIIQAISDQDEILLESEGSTVVIPFSSIVKANLMGE